MKRVMVGIVASVLFILVGCVSQPRQHPQAIWSETEHNNCLAKIEGITAYTTDRLSKWIPALKGVGKAMSVEVADSIGGSNLPPIPMSSETFENFIDREEKRNKAAGRRYEYYPRLPHHEVVVVTLEDVLGLAKSDRHYAQVFHNGKPCGVWEVEKKDD